MSERRFQESIGAKKSIEEQNRSNEAELTVAQKIFKELRKPPKIKGLNREIETIIKKRLVRERALIRSIEKEKNPEFTQLAEEAIELAQKEIPHYFPEADVDIDKDRIYFLKKHSSTNPEQCSLGCALIDKKEILIFLDSHTQLADYSRIAEKKYDQESYKIQLTTTVIHEIIHLVGFQKFFATRATDYTTNAFRTRTGYYTENEDLGSLNEAVVEKLAQEIVRKQAQQQKTVALPEFGSYKFDIKLLEDLIEGIARKNGEEKEIVWKRFVEGYFNGNMLHLREIEKTFGKGTLRKYAELKPNLSEADYDEFWRSDDEEDTNDYPG